MTRARVSHNGCGAGCAMQLWAVGVRGRAETPSCGRCGEVRAVRPCTASPATSCPPLCVCVCVCVCAPHSPAQAVGCAACEQAGAGCPARRSAGGGLCRLRSAVCAGAIAGLRGARRAFWSQGCASRCADFRPPTCGRVFAAFCVEPTIAESQPTELCKEPRHASRRGPNPSRGASAQRRARQDENKRTAARRRLHMDKISYLCTWRASGGSR